MTEKDIKALLCEITPSMADSFNDGIQKIHRYERCKKRLTWMISSTCIAAILSLSIHFVNTREVNDCVTTPYAQLIQSSAATEAPQNIDTIWVMTHPDDTYYHKDADCQLIIKGSVSLPQETVIELRKEPCTLCCIQDIDH